MIELLYLLGFILLLYVLFNCYLGISSKNWPTVVGMVESIKVVELKNPHSSADRTFYHPYVKYIYEINSKKYFSKSIDSRLAGSLNKESIEDLIFEFKEGHSATIYYNPYFHSISFLRVGLQQKMIYALLAFIGGILTVAGIGYLISGQELWLLYKVFEGIKSANISF